MIPENHRISIDNLRAYLQNLSIGAFEIHGELCRGGVTEVTFRTKSEALIDHVISVLGGTGHEVGATLDLQSWDTWLAEREVPGYEHDVRNYLLQFCVDRADALHTDLGDYEIRVEDEDHENGILLLTLTAGTVRIVGQVGETLLSAPTLPAQKLHVALALYDWVHDDTFKTVEHARASVALEGRRDPV